MLSIFIESIYTKHLLRVQVGPSLIDDGLPKINQSACRLVGHVVIKRGILGGTLQLSLDMPFICIVCIKK